MNVPHRSTYTSRPATPRAARERKSSVKEATDDLRERILGAALTAFAERGFHGTSVPDIARSAGVGVGSIYRHFDSKERLVNAVFREAKGRLRDALLLDFDLGQPPQAMFSGMWARLVAFQRAHTMAFQFLEMQDHVPYLDGESRTLEASLLAPILMALQSATVAETTRDGAVAGTKGDGKVAEENSEGTAALLIAIVWGAFVSLTKAERLGYLTLDDASLRRAGDICFAAVAHALRLDEGAASKARRPRKTKGE